MAFLAKSLEFPEMKQKLNTHQLYLHIWKCLCDKIMSSAYT